jgi:hypothetical protein
MDANDPLVAIGAYLLTIYDQARYRSYKYDYSLIVKPNDAARLTVTDGQLDFEFDHIMAKLKERSPSEYWFNYGFYIDGDILPNPMFEVIPGPVEGWEKQPIDLLPQPGRKD